MAADLSQWDQVYDDAAREWNVDPRLLKALTLQESRGDPNAVSKAGAQGLAQIMPATQRALGVADPFDPVQSIWGAAKYLSQGLDAEGNAADALNFYHGGPNWRQNYGPESAGYVPGVVAKYAALSPATTAPAGSKPVQVAQADTGTATDATSGPAPSAGGKMTDAEFLKSIGAAISGSGQDNIPTVTVTAPKPSMTDDDFLKSIGAQTEAPKQNTTQPASQRPPLGWTGIAAGTLGALNKGLSFGLDNPLDAATSWLFPNSGFAKAQAANQALQTQYDQNYPLTSTTAQVLGSMPTYAIAEGALAKAIPQAATLGKDLLGSAARNAIVSGVAGAGLTDGDLATRAQGAATGAVAGGVAAPVLGAVGAAGNALLGRTGIVSPDIAQLAQVARDKYSIPITAPQLSTNQLVQNVASQSARLPLSGAGSSAAAQQAAWQRAVIGTFGEDAALATPEVMQRAATRIGGVFNDVAQRTKIQADQPLINDLGRIETDATQALPDAEQGPIKKQLDAVLDVAAKGNGTISGDAYQALTRANAPLGRAESSADPNVRFYAGQIRDALDDAFQRSAAPEDQAALAQARAQYRAMKTVQPLVEKSPDGNLSPTLLLSQVARASRRFDPSTGGLAYTGGGDLGELARIGKQFLKQAPDSGTADRLMTYGLISGAVPAAIANPLATAAIPAGLAANRAANAYLRSGWLANRLIRNSLNPTLPQRLLVPLSVPPIALGTNALQQRKAP